MNGTAEAGSDYIAQRSTLIFEPGETEKVIEIEIIDDNEWEPDETFFVKLAMDANNEASLGHRSVMQVIIMNDDGKAEQSTHFKLIFQILTKKLPMQRLVYRASVLG